MAESLLSLKGLGCTFDDNIVLDQFNLEVSPGQIICLLGPSGCGKTTVLRSIAGFQSIDSGEIVLRSSRVSASGYTLAPEKRGLGMVFQDYALFPHLNIVDNICFGLRGKRKAEKNKIASDLLSMVGLMGMEDRYAHELSGGQQQRIALARALAVKPDLILMDEPFSNLDVDLRERLGLDVRNILKELGIAAIMVTHDQIEAFSLADVIGVMRYGKILQSDSPYNLYHEPVDRDVAGFIGQGVFIDGILLSPHVVQTELGVIKGNRAYAWQTGTALDLLLRPDDIEPDPGGKILATVTHRAFRGASILYTLQLPSKKEILALFSSHFDYDLGASVGIKLSVEHLIAFCKSADTIGGVDV